MGALLFIPSSPGLQRPIPTRHRPSTACCKSSNSYSFRNLTNFQLGFQGSTSRSRSRSRFILNASLDISTLTTLSTTSLDTLKVLSASQPVLDPWSISQSSIDQLAGNFFALSLIPYLAFLYYLGREKSECPAQALFGFKFLLVFVFATIPAGIAAKVVYHDILANVDVLHGAAESMLTLTNLFIVEGFRRHMVGQKREMESDGPMTSMEKRKGNRKKEAAGSDSTPLSVAGNGKFSLPKIIAASTSMVLLTIYVATYGLAPHTEPSNALSFPTWLIHISSLLEWLAAMALVWQYSAYANNDRWKGLTWGMLPLHASGLMACTFHFFFNSSDVGLLVVSQAALTAIGNTTMAYAAYRIANDPVLVAASVENAVDAQVEYVNPNTNDCWINTIFGTIVISALLKYGEPYMDLAYLPQLFPAAAALVVIPTIFNALKWAIRSGELAIDSRWTTFF